MRLLIVTRRVGRHDGQGRVNLEIAREALRQGHTVRLIAESADTEILAAGASLARLPAPAFLPGRLLRDQVFALRATLAQQRTDAVLANGFCSWAAADVNAVHFVHGAWLSHPHHPWRQAAAERRTLSLGAVYAGLYSAANKTLERGAFRRAGRIVAVSAKLRGELLAAGVAPARIATILNGVDTAEFAPGPAPRAAFALPEGVTLALFAGDLRTPRKNLDTVLSALVGAPNLHLVVAGQAEATPWPALAQRLGVTDRVHFLGFCTDMPALMRAADMFVFPSRYEACSLVLLEAMASGLPVITAASAGGAEIVSPAAGFVMTDCEDAAALSAAMRRLAEDAGLRSAMGRAARAIAVTHGWRGMAQQYLDLLTAAVQARTDSGARLATDRAYA